MTKEEFSKLSEEDREKYLRTIAHWYRMMDSEQAGDLLPPFEKYYEELKNAFND